MKILLTSLLLALFLSANLTAETMSDFTWTIQQAGYDFDRYDHKGKTDYSEFIGAFEAFPWAEQHQEYNQKNEGASATLSVKDAQTDTSLWVSIAGDNENPFFLVGYIYEKKTKSLFGKEKKKKWMEIYAVFEKSDVPQYFELYFQRSFADLHIHLKKLDLFGEMEPAGQN